MNEVPTNEGPTEQGLVVSDLSVRYGGVVALQNVNLSVPPGAFRAVLGPNGAGKTTLVRAITGLLYLHKGRVRGGSITLNGRSIAGEKTRVIVRNGVAQVPEGRMLFARLTVEENLRCGAATRSDRAELDQTLEEVWELFPQIEKLRKQTAGLLSGGEQQMVAVGRALMSRPTLLVCDELSLGLAPKIVAQLFELLTEINSERGVSILVIEQNARLALEHAAHASVLELGEVLLEGEAAELRDNPLVQELYLGGGGEAQDAYAHLARERRRR